MHVPLTCPTCGAAFTVSEGFLEGRLANLLPVYCPAGHAVGQAPREPDPSAALEGAAFMRPGVSYRRSDPLPADLCARCGKRWDDHSWEGCRKWEFVRPGKVIRHG